MAAESPDDSLAHLTLGQCVAQMGDYGAAEISFRAPGPGAGQGAGGILPGPEPVQGRRTTGRAGRRRPGAGGKAVSGGGFAGPQGTTTKPDYGYAYMVLGLSQKGRGRRAEALSALRQAVQCNPEVAEFHLYFGELLSDDGHAAEARSQLEEALRLAPPGAPWRQEARDRLK